MPAFIVHFGDILVAITSVHFCGILSRFHINNLVPRRIFHLPSVPFFGRTESLVVLRITQRLLPWRSRILLHAIFFFCFFSFVCSFLRHLMPAFYVCCAGCHPAFPRTFRSHFCGQLEIRCKSTANFAKLSELSSTFAFWRIIFRICRSSIPKISSKNT